VPRLPSAVLAVAFVGAGMLSFTCGLILDTSVSNARKTYELQVLEAYQRYGKRNKGGK
jgi:hypothetical protein